MPVPIPPESLPVIAPGSTTTVSISATSTQSAAINADVIRLVATSACHVAIGPNPTATTSSMYLAPDTPEYFRIYPGNKVAVIRNAVNGTLFITSAS